jgi:hypothetical protein
MGPGEHRPHGEEYRQRLWHGRCSQATCSRPSPSAIKPTVVYSAEHDDTPGKHFLGEIAFGYGLLVYAARLTAVARGSSSELCTDDPRALPPLPSALLTSSTSKRAGSNAAA